MYVCMYVCMYAYVCLCMYRCIYSQDIYQKKKSMDLNIHCTCRGPTLVILHSLVELVGSPVLACIYIFIYLYIGTATTEHTNINNINNK